MEQTEPSPRPVAGDRRAALFRSGGLVLTVVALVVTSFLSLRAPASKSSLDATQLQVDTLVRARALYSMRSLAQPGVQPEVARRRAALIADLTRLADLSPTPRAIRRLALVQYAFQDPGWRASLLRLRAVPHSGPTFETEKELGFWSRLFEGEIHPDAVPSIVKRIESFHLGWYEHLARETLYRRAGLNERANREAEAANSSTSRLLLGLNLAVLTGICGMVFGGRQILLALRAKRAAKRSSFEFVSSAPAPRYAPPPRPQADVLYSGFVIYLATFALIRLLLGQLAGRTLSALLSGMRPEASLAIQIGISLLSLVPAVAWLIVVGRRAGVTAASLGLTTRSLPREIVWGFCGYAVALPLVYLSSIISGWLFRGVQSPPHPAIAELASSRGLLYVALMFLQVAVIPPITEELMFRGVFFRSLTARVSIPAAVVLTSALFAILHPQLPLGFLGIFVLGVVFNLLALHRRSLVPGIVAHALNNGVIFAFFILLMTD